MLKTYIIGLGQIGMGYDINNTKDNHCRTHVKSILNHPDFRLIGGYDNNNERQAEFSRLYNYPILKYGSDHIDCDIVVISTPTNTHKEVVESLLSYISPSVILIEKPLASNIHDAEFIIDLCKRHKTSLFVNYMRNSSPGTIKIKEMLNTNKIEYPIIVNAWHTKSLLHNGSHLLALFENLFGNITRIITPQLANKSIVTTANFKGDNSYIQIHRAYHLEYTLFEFTLYAKNGVLRYHSSGEIVNWFPSIHSEEFIGYNFLSNKPINISTFHYNYQYHVYDNIAKYLNGSGYNLCDGHQALSSLKLALSNEH